MTWWKAKVSKIYELDNGRKAVDIVNCKFRKRFRGHSKAAVIEDMQCFPDKDGMFHALYICK